MLDGHSQYWNDVNRCFLSMTAQVSENTLKCNMRYCSLGGVDKQEEPRNIEQHTHPLFTHPVDYSLSNSYYGWCKSTSEITGLTVWKQTSHCHNTSHADILMNKCVWGGGGISPIYAILTPPDLIIITSLFLVGMRRLQYEMNLITILISLCSSPSLLRLHYQCQQTSHTNV